MNTNMTGQLYIEKGLRESSREDWFDVLTISIQEDETTLIGTVRDQSSLHGNLPMINGLGSPIFLSEVISQALKEGTNHG